MIYLQLFWEFFKTGLFAVGGGMATLPFLQKMGDATGWFTAGQLADMVAVSESTPGPIGVNMATYVGYTCVGIPGALIATIGLITPSVVIILIIAALLKNFRDNRYVNAAFYGLRPASSALIMAALLVLAGTVFIHMDLFAASGAVLDLIDLKAWILAAVVLVLTRWVKWTKGLHPIVFILGSAVVGIVFRFAGV